MVCVRREGGREGGREGANLTLDQLLGNLDGGLTECASVLGTDLRAHCEVGRLITVGLGEGVCVGF